MAARTWPSSEITSESAIRNTSSSARVRVAAPPLIAFERLKVPSSWLDSMICASGSISSHQARQCAHRRSRWPPSARRGTIIGTGSGIEDLHVVVAEVGGELDHGSAEGGEGGEMVGSLTSVDGIVREVLDPQT